ncbi:MAG TPA: hypothetical protein VLT33_24950 [Labilithrix sp.]|nr:hypothetical protein [Labilithrix sp.]
MLQLVTQHASFAWLRPLSRLVIDLDDPDALAAAGSERALAERLFTPGNLFHERYVDVLQAEPHVGLAHAEVKRAIAALPERAPPRA